MVSNPDAGLEDLIRLAKNGCGSELGILLERYRNYLTLLARLHIGRRLQGKVDATDLVQETFLKASRDFARFRGHGEPELTGWLRRILATNLAMLLRRYCGTQQRDVRLEEQLAEELDQSSRLLDRGLIAPTSSPSHQAARREQGVLLADALSRLPLDYREVLILRHMEGLSFPEVAKQMERSVDAVKKLWARALVQLRGSMGVGE